MNEIQEYREELDRVLAQIQKRILGQEEILRQLMIAVIAGGHVLVEGVPGLGKTLLVRTFAEVIDAEFKRIQFTPDLLPADLTGTMIYRQSNGEFVARKGPLFANVILADELNRAPAKVQSALLEAMGEKQVTIGEHTFALPSPFFVFGTQNPIEHEGTYPLPEAQLDRFMFRLKMHYPSPDEEKGILHRMGNEEEIPIQKILFPDFLRKLKQYTEKIWVEKSIEDYIVQIITASRPSTENPLPFHRYIDFGASPRGTLFLYRAARVHAFLENRDFVLPEDVKAVAYPTLRHRILLSYEGEAEGLDSDDLIRSVLSRVKVP